MTAARTLFRQVNTKSKAFATCVERGCSDDPAAHAHVSKHVTLVALCSGTTCKVPLKSIQTRHTAVSLCLSVSLCVSLCLSVSLCIPLCLSVSLCVPLCLSVSLFPRLSVCLSVSLSDSLSHSLSHCPHLSLSLSLSLTYFLTLTLSSLSPGQKEYLNQ